MAAGGEERHRLQCRSNNNLRVLSPFAILLSVASLVPRKARNCVAAHARAAPSKWWSFKLPVAAPPPPPSPSTARPRGQRVRRARERPARAARSCAHCKVTETPQWRSSLLEEEGMLCNACGLRVRDAHAMLEMMLHGRPPATARVKAKKAKKLKLKAKKAKPAATATAVVSEPETPQPLAEIPPVSGSLSPPGSPIWDEMLHLNVYLHRRASPRQETSPQPPSPTAEAAPAVEKKPKWCTNCGALSSPMWRSGPLGVSTLCNACGIRYKEGRLDEGYRPSTRRGRRNKKCEAQQQQPPPPPAPPAVQLREERMGIAQRGPLQPAGTDAALLMDESIAPFLFDGTAAPMVIDDEPVTVIVIDD